MAINYPGPYQIRVHYVVATFDHVLALNVNIPVAPDLGENFLTIAPITRGGSTAASLKVKVDELIGLLRPLYALDDSAFALADLWAYEPNSFDASFVSTYDIALAGSAGGSATAAAQEIFTFRTQEGGIFKLVLMETISGHGNSQVYNDISLARQDLVDNFLLDSNVWLARDTSYPFAFIKRHPGQNEAMFRRRFR
jgi:hypothetical protein